jgi:ABC-type phosphate transport system substrate-binding protein
MSARRGRGAVLAAAGLLVALAAGVLPARAFPLGGFCDKNRAPDYIEGQGTRSHLSLTYRLWLPSYYAKCRKMTGTILYYGTSDSYGARAMHQRIGLFYGRDIPLTPVEQQLIQGDLPSTSLDYIGLRGRIDDVQHIPVYVGALSVAYNLNCLSSPLRLRGEALAAIFAGVIKTWDDPLLLRDTPKLAACKNRAVKLAVRSDESGASTVLKDYLAKRAPIWRPYLLPQLNTSWPPTANIVCKGYGEDGVAGCVASRQGAVGYTSVRAATTLGLQQAYLDNQAGQYAPPSLAGCQKAAEATPPPATSTGDWSNVSLTNPTSGYAVCSLSYILIWLHPDRAYGPINVGLEQVANLRDYMRTILSDPIQAKLPVHGVAPLPSAWRSLSRQGVDRMSYIEP